MSKHQKNASLSILYVLLFAAISVQSTKCASASAFIPKIIGGNQKIEIDKNEIANLNSAIFESNHTTYKVTKSKDFLAKQKGLEDRNRVYFSSQVRQLFLNAVTNDFVDTEKLIAEVSLDTFTGKNPEDDELSNEPNLALDMIRKVSLLFFLIFFLPLGIFYPLFLVYRKLLDIDEDVKPLEEEVFENSLSIPPPLEDFELDLHSDQATVSKLQVAFLPKIANLKQQLEQANLNIDKQSDYKAIDLMRSAISIFITQQHWTHASYDSSSFSVVEALEEFDIVLSMEQDKCIDKKLSVVHSVPHPKKPENQINHNQDIFKYTVVTMLFYTTGESILFEQMDTKESLAKLLIDLSQINEDELLKFELIWNPVKEDEFITNEQLLMHYEDMVRLF